MERGWYGWKKDGNTPVPVWKVRNRRSIMGGSLSTLPLSRPLSTDPSTTTTIEIHTHYRALVSFFSNRRRTPLPSTISHRGTGHRGPLYPLSPPFASIVRAANNNHDTVDWPIAMTIGNRWYIEFCVARRHRIIVLQRRRCTPDSRRCAARSKTAATDTPK